MTSTIFIIAAAIVLITVTYGGTYARQKRLRSLITGKNQERIERGWIKKKERKH